MVCDSDLDGTPDVKELRAGTDQVQDWMKVRSELSVAITAALRAANITLR